MTAFVESLSSLIGALALLVFAFAALYLARSIFKLHPDLGKLIRKFARIDRASDLRRIVRRALEDESQPMIDVTPRKRKAKPKKLEVPPKLPAAVEP